MSNFPFGQSMYRQFQNTFLASVQVEIAFPQVQEVASRTDAWRKYVEEMFSMEPIDGIFKIPIVVRRNDNKLSFCFENGRSQVHINGDGYQNFADSVIPHAYKLKQFVMDVAGCEHPSQISIRKIDIFQIKPTSKEKIEEDHIRNHFFSKEYVALKDNLAKLNGEEEKMPSMVKHQWQDEAKQLTIRSVFFKDPDKEGKYRLVLDAEERYAPKEKIDFGKLDLELKDINMDLFNAYMWCVSEKVKMIMDSRTE